MNLFRNFSVVVGVRSEETRDQMLANTQGSSDKEEKGKKAKVEEKEQKAKVKEEEEKQEGGRKKKKEPKSKMKRKK